MGLSICFADKLQNDLNYWKNRPVHKKVIADQTFRSLSTEQVKEVEKLLFFTGYPRSGHSILGSLLDAHPNIILSYAFFLFRRLMVPSGKKRSIEGLLHNRTLFFNTIYELSYHYSLVSSEKLEKGYTLDVPGMWSGKINGTLKVIGDKSATATTVAYSTASHEKFKSRYTYLAKCTGVELVAIHVTRNPFDMIATHALYKVMHGTWKRNQSKTREKVVIDRSILLKVVEFYFDKAKAVKEMVPLCDMKVIEVHSENLIRSPRKQLQHLCNVLDVYCSEEYLQTCESKIYPEVSRTRDKIVWPPDVKADVQKRMQHIPFFGGYTFEDDFYYSD